MVGPSSVPTTASEPNLLRSLSLAQRLVIWVLPPSIAGTRARIWYSHHFRSPLTRRVIPRLLGRDDAAFYVGVSGPHFDAHVAPHVQSIRLGRRRLFDVRALDGWLDVKFAPSRVSRSATEWLELLK